jgi:hypothetical protein
MFTPNKIQWGSEYWTYLVFEWSKCVQTSNGPLIGSEGGMTQPFLHSDTTFKIVTSSSKEHEKLSQQRTLNTQAYIWLNQPNYLLTQPYMYNTLM